MQYVNLGRAGLRVSRVDPEVERLEEPCRPHAIAGHQ
jgi:hypothetical protein